jgi:acetyl-CoA carboxylase biotin carboxyl carrier protein
MRIKTIKKIVEILEKSIVTEIEITDILGRKLKISKSSNTAQAPVQTSEIPPTQVLKTVEEAPAKQVDTYKPIKSPIVGTFYRAPAPDAPPYVEVGDVVKPGQVVCIVEAMKLLNEIESDINGKVVKILVKNEDPVEYNQDLFLVEPL